VQTLGETDLSLKEAAPFGYHFLWYFLQLIFAAPGVVIAGTPFWFVLRLFGLNEGNQPENFGGYEALMFLYVGVLVGWGMAHRAPLLSVTGRWIWILPVAFILPDVLKGFFRSPVPSLSELLFASTGGGGGVALITIPVCSIVGYSLGMTASVELLRAKGSSVIAIAVIACSLLGLAMHAFETRFLQRWSNIRTVVQSGGIQVVQNAGYLCEEAYSGWTSKTLPFPTHVEVLGRVTCDRNKIVASDNLPPPAAGGSSPYLLLHVRVLDGPIAGQEGWTMEYGLKESRSLHY
jgi:hypothetical protein